LEIGVYIISFILFSDCFKLKRQICRVRHKHLWAG